MIRLRWISFEIKLDRCGRFGPCRVRASTKPDSPLARDSTTRQRRFIRAASLAGVSFLLDAAADGIGGNIAPTLPRDSAGLAEEPVRREAEGSGDADYQRGPANPLTRNRSRQYAQAVG